MASATPALVLDDRSEGVPQSRQFLLAQHCRVLGLQIVGHGDGITQETLAYVRERTSTARRPNGSGVRAT